MFLWILGLLIVLVASAYLLLKYRIKDIVEDVVRVKPTMPMKLSLMILILPL